ncbi:solute carrier family 22 member 6-A-like [Trachemys scripta elegans]|uniref:solute carrier family 22 member 6-A-like n=1 Tax=Trachemys scripta elegans TaxID=31138 RepID=UPI001552233D|nr:solute carrier family 22 member 6-A-like [Trachemys scripta elegans]
MAQSIYMAGVLAGGIIFGGLSDRFGRRSPLIWCYLQMAVTSTCTAFSPSFTAYCIFRFLTGMAISGIVMNSVSLCKCVWRLPSQTQDELVTGDGRKCLVPAANKLLCGGSTERPEAHTAWVGCPRSQQQKSGARFFQNS